MFYLVDFYIVKYIKHFCYEYILILPMFPYKYNYSKFIAIPEN